MRGTLRNTSIHSAPQNVLSSVHQKSPGLALISQLGSESDESSSSDSEMSTSDEEEEVPAITE